MNSIHKGPHVFWVYVRIEAMAQVRNVPLGAKPFQHHFHKLSNFLLPNSEELIGEKVVSYPAIT